MDPRLRWQLDRAGGDGSVRPFDEIELLGNRGQKACDVRPREVEELLQRSSDTLSGSITNVTRRSSGVRQG